MQTPDKSKPSSDVKQALSDSLTLINALRNDQCYPHPVSRLDIIETHASWVILTGVHAYKIKKPVDLEFLDYSTLEKRRQACHEELRLNRTLAPELYIDVVPITGSVSAPHMKGEGDAIEYAVHMRQFDQACQLDHRLEHGELRMQDMDDAARHVAAFHIAVPVMDLESAYGRAQDIHQPVLDNFTTIVPLLAGQHSSVIAGVRDWSESEYRRCYACMDMRRELGYVRESHGDLHLANLVQYRGQILAFDRLEFSAALRWIDVMNDVAFLAMDLLYHQRSDLAFRFLNSYLQATGDYRGLNLLRYYLVYRAMVRAKVALLKAIQNRDPLSAASARRDAELHIELAASITQHKPVQLVLMHGLSGSGKTWLSEQLMTALPAVRLRSDVERKRIHGQVTKAHSNAAPGAGLYTKAEAERTYQDLAALAESVCTAGWSVIVDAAFLHKWQRRMFQELTLRLVIPWMIVDCNAPEQILKERVERRLAAGADPSEANLEVLQYQLAVAEPLDDMERKRSLNVELLNAIDVKSVLDQLRFNLDNTVT